jgi:hypothetical protein
MNEEQRKARRLAVKKFVSNNPGFASAKKKRYNKRHPEKARAKRLLDRYGLTVEQHEALLKHQNDSCALCKRHKSTNELGLHIDHCHKTDKVRGILCPSCNQALGLLQDNPELCELAASYLKDCGKQIEHITTPNSDPIKLCEEKDFNNRTST